jgi:4'-phosphopantetheinyl transferase
MVEFCLARQEPPSESKPLNKRLNDVATQVGNAAPKDTSVLWPPTPEPWPVRCARPGIVEILAVSLDLSLQALDSLRAALSPAELRRADRFYFHLHRARFIAGRGQLRTILGKYLGIAPSELKFAYGPHGKPELAGKEADSGLRFNLAHCENLALIAVTDGQRIGVDLERIRVMPDVGDLVSRFFSAPESAAFHALPEAQKPDAFFNLWTRKEAWLKASGEGISRYLNQVEVTFLPGEPARIMSLPPSTVPQVAWSLGDLRPVEQFAAAIAVEGESAACQCWRWDFARTETL